MTDLSTALSSNERRRLIGLAYRITGDRGAAEDLVQEAWIRWNRVDQTGVERPAAWLTVVTSRLALDHLRSATRRREDYVGPYLPDAVASTPGPDVAAELAESLTFGFLAVLERLDPVERVVFVLADVFAVPFGEIADVVDRSEEACRQVASRARRRVRDERPRFEPTGDAAVRVAEELVTATAGGDVADVIRLLAPDLVLVSDGGRDHHAARRPITDPHRAARLLINLTERSLAQGYRMETRPVNGQPGLVGYLADDPAVAVAVSVVDGLVNRISIVVNPEKLLSLDLDDLD